MTKTNLLASLAMTKLAAHETARGTTAWSGTITRDGRPLCVVSNDGWGGCNRYRPIDWSAWPDTFDAIESAARAATGLPSEAFDMLTAYMENGTTAEQAAVAFQKDAPL